MQVKCVEGVKSRKGKWLANRFIYVKRPTSLNISWGKKKRRRDKKKEGRQNEHPELRGSHQQVDMLNVQIGLQNLKGLEAGGPESPPT